MLFIGGLLLLLYLCLKPLSYLFLLLLLCYLLLYSYLLLIELLLVSLSPGLFLYLCPLCYFRDNLRR